LDTEVIGVWQALWIWNMYLNACRKHEHVLKISKISCFQFCRHLVSAEWVLSCTQPASQWTYRQKICMLWAGQSTVLGSVEHTNYASEGMTKVKHITAVEYSWT
jgi:hypothetical protein